MSKTNACSTCCSPYTLGLFFILCVSLIWSAASILVQFLYTKQSFDSPFLLTYIGVSLFTILLPTKFAWVQCQKCMHWICRTWSRRRGSLELEIPNAIAASPMNLGEYENIPSVLDESDSSLQNSDRFNDEETTEGQPQEQNDRELPIEPYRDEQDEEEGVETSNSGERLPTSRDTHLESPAPEQPWSNSQHMRVALKIAPVWFIANWAYNASLAYTSITSSTVLASTGSLFTFLFAVVYGDERFSCWKLVGVLLGVTGSLLTALHDANIGGGDMNDENNSLGLSEEDGSRGAVPLRLLVRKLLVGTYRNGSWWSSRGALFGDALGLTSAVGYGAYAVMVRVLCPRDETLMSMEILLGYIGLFNMVALSPILIYQLIAGSHKQLTLVVFGFLVVKGLLDNVLSDYLWARSVILTSATVATVGLGLTIPLAFLSDVLWMGQAGDQVVSLSSVAGALSVLAGFVIVNIATDSDDDVGGDANNDILEVVNASEEEDSGDEPIQLATLSKVSSDDEEELPAIG